jgi:hypothetical protein
MGFPYLAPIKGWMKSVLEEREQHPTDTAFKMPWIVLTSGAKVVKASQKSENPEEKVETLKKIIGGTSGTTEYYGCIIKNNIDVGLNYQQNETIVGIDFNGKPIKVEGETNRRVSTPIIESVDIDTDGANNTLKTATVSVRCFTLKQFEMFELFFCKPGMNVLLEYGDNTLDRKKYEQSGKNELKSFTKSSEALIDKTDYNTFVQTFSDYYRVNTKSLKDYLSKIERAKGTYDLVAGKITDYNFAIDKDGTYTVSLEISQGNQMTLAIPTNISNDKSSIASKSKEKATTFEQWVSQLSADLKLDKSVLKLDKTKWEHDFFNWNKLNITKKDETANSDQYVSLRFILKELMNYSIIDGNIDKNTFEFITPTYKVNGIDTEIIPISIHKHIISSSDDVLFPNKTLPKFVAKIKPSGSVDAKPQDNIEISNITDVGTINGYSIEETQKVEIELENGKLKIVNPTEGDKRCGNALNIFIKYKVLVEIWRKSYTRADFLNGILSVVNSNSYGLFRLVYAPQAERKAATVIDFKSTNTIQITEENLYKFKPTTINSIVKDFTFNFEMSNLVAGRTVFNSQRFLAEHAKKLADDKKKGIAASKEIPLSADIYQSVDYSMFSNADGFYSINMIDLEAIKNTLQTAVDTGNIQAEKDTKAEKNEAVNFTEIIEDKSIKFILPSGIKTLVFTDRELIINKLKINEEASSNTLTPIDVTIAIDGISGFSCGEYFNIVGVPEIYNQIGVFQITNTKHNISNEGWTTTLEAGFRINKKNK